MTTESLAPADEAVSYADAVDIGLRAVGQIDSGRYIIGDLALLVTAHYGQDEIGRFSDDINLEAKRVQEYRTVCKYYPPQIRAQFEGTSINYSIFREAMRLGDLDASLDMLHAAAAGLMRVRDVREAINARAGKAAAEPPVFVGPLRFHVEDGRVLVTGLEGVVMTEGVAYSVTIRYSP